MVLVLAGLLTEKEKYVYNNIWQSKSCHRYFREKGKRKEQKEKNTDAARKASSEVLGLRSSSLICSVTTYLNLYKYHSL